MALDTTTTVAAERNRWRSLWATGISTCVILAVLVAVAYVCFGSVRSGLAYLRGDRVLLGAASQSFGTVQQGQVLEVRFTLKNLSDRPVQVLGAQVNCSCMRAEGLPFALGPSASQPLRFTVSTRSLSGAVSKPIRIYTDFRPQRAIALEIKGNVIGNPPGRIASPTSGEGNYR